MRIGIVTPAPPGSTHGNRITAVRWAKILTRLGHRISISQVYEGEEFDLLIALHASRSYQSIKRFRREQRRAPIVVALTGTDVYGDLSRNSRTGRALEVAIRVIALQPRALKKLQPGVRAKTRVIYQSVGATVHANSSAAIRRSFDVCVIGHLRPVKDPFRAALAARLLPASSRIRILQIGGAMTTAMATRALAESRRNPRYRWLGETTQSRAKYTLTRCQLSVLSSRVEGGANVLSETIISGVPPLASRIDGNIGILGKDYPGLFRVGDTQELARLLLRAESEPRFLRDLRRKTKQLTRLFNPERELRAWAELIDELR
jgi:putative glycosyltransferase (TIGR04348 family)